MARTVEQMEAVGMVAEVYAAMEREGENGAKVVGALLGKSPKTVYRWVKGKGGPYEREAKGIRDKMVGVLSGMAEVRDAR